MKKPIPRRPLLLKGIVMAALACFLFTAISLFPASAAQAATGTFQVTGLSWAKSKVDTTLKSKSNPMNVKLKISAINTISGSNKIAITIQNTKSKAKLTSYADKNGGTATFLFHNAKKHKGKWKVISVKAVKKGKKVIGKVPGYWQFGRWQPGTDLVKDTSKTLYTETRSGPFITVKCGSQTKVTLSSPKSIYASAKTVTLKATLKNEKGKPVKGQKVKFQLVPGLESKNTITKSNKPIVVTAKTNSKGVATVKAKTPQVAYSNTAFRGFTTTVYYMGKAKKFCASESKAQETTQPKEKTAFVLAPTWDGHTGMRSFSVKLVVSSGSNKGKAVSGIPIDWRFKDARTGGMYHQITTKTDSTGTAKTSWNVKEWFDYDVMVNATLETMKKTPYVMPALKTYQIKKKTSIVKYTVNTSKVSLLGGNDPSGSWFTYLSTAPGKAFITVAGAEGVLVDAAGKPLPHVGTTTKNKISCTIVSAAVGNAPLVQNKEVQFNLNAANKFPVATANKFPVDSGGRTATEVRVTLTLPTFTGLYNGEFQFEPMTPTVSWQMSG